MTDPGSDNEPDIWANTRQQPADPSTGLPAQDAVDPTTVQPTQPGGPTPTAEQPVTPGPLGASAAGVGAASYVTGPGGAPPPQPPIPPTGGPGGPGGPDDPMDPGASRPVWLMPAAIGLLIGVVAAGLIYLITRDDEGDETLSTDASTTTSVLDTTIAPDTTIAVDTTVAPETTIVSETTVAPTTPATTSSPTTTEAATTTTAAPTTTVPEGITPAEPGQALVADEAYDLVNGCTTNPAPGYSVRSFVAMDEFGPLVIEEGNDGGDPFGLFSEAGNSLVTEGYTELGDGFGMLAVQSGGGFEVAVNPGDIAVGDCATQGSAQLSDPDSPDAKYTHGVVDVCTTNAPLRAVAYLSEGGSIRVDANGDGTALITLNTSEITDATDPDATIMDVDGRQVIVGEITGSTVDGNTTLSIQFEFDSTSARACTDAESA